MPYSGTPKDRKAQIQEDLKAVAGTLAGRRFMHWLITRKCLVGESIFTGNSATFYKRGRRDVGLELERLWQAADMAGFQLAERENWEDEKAKESENVSRSSGNSGRAED